MMSIGGDSCGGYDNSHTIQRRYAWNSEVRSQEPEVDCAAGRWYNGAVPRTPREAARRCDVVPNRHIIIRRASVRGYRAGGAARGIAVSDDGPPFEYGAGGRHSLRIKYRLLHRTTALRALCRPRVPLLVDAARAADGGRRLGAGRRDVVLPGDFTGGGLLRFGGSGLSSGRRATDRALRWCEQSDGDVYSLWEGIPGMPSVRC